MTDDHKIWHADPSGPTHLYVPTVLSASNFRPGDALFGFMSKWGREA